MFNGIPARFWLLVVIAFWAFAPAKYLWRHFSESPDRRDITQPAEDESWRSTGNMILSLAKVAALAGVAIFIFTPTAEKVARSPQLMPLILLALGAVAFYSAGRGVATGGIAPMAQGSWGPYDRNERPGPFWASLAWNVVLGGALLWLAFTGYGQIATDALQTRCYGGDGHYKPAQALTACNSLIDQARQSGGDDIASLVAARGYAHHSLGDIDRAFADYSTALLTNPRDKDSYFNRGLIYEYRGNAARAIEDFSNAIRLDPDWAEVYDHRATMYVAINDDVLSAEDRASAARARKRREVKSGSDK